MQSRSPGSRDATEQHVSDGIVTQDQRAGNHLADRYADAGVKCHGQDTFDFAKTYSDRAKGYAKLYLDIVTHIIDGYLIHKELLRIKEAKDNAAALASDNKRLYLPLRYPDGAGATKLHFRSDITFYPLSIKRRPALPDIQTFLQQLWVVPSSQDNSRGITWLELYTLYRIQGFQKPLQDTANPAKAKTSITKQVAAFKVFVRCVVDKACLDDTQTALFHPLRVVNYNLTYVNLCRVIWKACCFILRVCHIPGGAAINCR